MATNGWYNHYDDPDEFWDEEPLEVNPALNRGQDPAFASSGIDVPLGNSGISEVILLRAGLIEMTLDADRLPVRVEVNRNLHSRLEPENFSDAAMAGYYLALWKNDAPIIARGRFTELSVMPSRRAQIIALLGTRSRSQFEAVERVLRGRDEYTADGPRTSFGTHSVSVVASLSRISRIIISPDWAATAEPSYIAHDIVDCANRIRDRRPKFGEEGVWSHRSDDELERELAEYKNHLMRSS
ncbi:hypothetical protein [Nocardia amamiensis]|uniref:hypothetical protein n=1 Tax=Nocardia amamiensis TaxID=404578 RepID=UPI000AC8C569|nr:hypothetical protein [Nocardia amamiensis]